MTQRSDLEKEARKFARELIGLLNNTVTNGIRLSTHIDQHGNAVIDYRDPSSSELGAVIPMKIDRKPARFGLRVQHTLTLEDGTGYLRNSKRCSIQLASPHAPPNGSTCLSVGDASAQASKT